MDGLYVQRMMIETLNVQFLDELMLHCQGCQVHKLLFAHSL